METVTVSAKALRQLLEALYGPPHLINELRVIHDLNTKMGMEERTNDPISSLVASYNTAAVLYKAAQAEKESGDANS